MDLTPYMDYAVYALIVVGVLIIVMLLIRMIGNKVRGKQGSRLGVSEFHELDKSRRLVLIRRDDVEHLVMIGGPQDVVIEDGIGLEEAVQPRHAQTPRPPEFLSGSRGSGDSADVTPIAPRAPKPAVFGDRAPNLRPIDDREEPKLANERSEKVDQNPHPRPGGQSSR